MTSDRLDPLPAGDSDDVGATGGEDGSYRPEGAPFVAPGDDSYTTIYEPAPPLPPDIEPAVVEPVPVDAALADPALADPVLADAAAVVPAESDQKPVTEAPAHDTAGVLGTALYDANASAQPLVRRRVRRILTGIGFFLAAAVIGGAAGAGTYRLLDEHRGSADSGLQITDQPAPAVAPLDGTITAAAAKIRPSVVTIDVAGSAGSGTGSGVILRTDGYILTNEHVAAAGGARANLVVVLSDGRRAPAQIVGQDQSDDLAVLRVTGLANLTPVVFGRSSELTVGQTVVAVGAPLGLSDTVTSGIVSNVARPVRTGQAVQAVFQAIQTDAAINPGNSGGPLVDLNGSVVGINAAIASDSGSDSSAQGGSIGIGFAIPSDEAARIAGELILSGKATHAVLGVTVGTDSTTGGLLVQSVNPKGPADRGGIRKGDQITSVGDRPVATADALIAVVRSYAPRQVVTVHYVRKGSVRTAQIVLAAADS